MQEQAQRQATIDPQWVTTAFSIDGARILRNLGVVRGITVRSRSVVGSIGAAFQQLGGGNITLYTELAEHSRDEAFQLMLQHAAAIGANGIIGMRYDATEMSNGVTEVLAYGTAVGFETARSRPDAGGRPMWGQRGGPRDMAMGLAGGQGPRLQPLTIDRAKPAVPFGGTYRLIDFALSNLVNGGISKIVVLTQYKSHSLDRHIAQMWRLLPMLGNYVATVPAQMRTGPRWFAGSADAVYQNLNLVRDEKPNYICVFGADHIYRMGPSQMIAHHMASGAGVTLAGIRVPIKEAQAFGIIEPDHRGRVAAFLEKPDNPPRVPGAPGQAYASMGIYVFSTQTLVDAVTEDS